jgi:hypothetical protein
MMQVGDRVELESEKVGRKPRAGVVTQIQGALIGVKWETGEESMFVPAAGSLRVVGRQRGRAKR